MGPLQYLFCSSFSLVNFRLVANYSRSIGAYGVLIGGLQMFHEAVASLYSKQMGFQVLTSITVIGASILGMWEEALMVVILVAIAGHLENSALDNARELMQGGLDRIPRTRNS